MTTLAEIFRKYGTDKYAHGYFSAYEKLPAPARLLEIGVWKGASLRAWREWWPDAFIHGMDTFQRGVPPPGVLDDRGELWKADSRDVWLPTEYHGRFDLIIDDASHRPRDQAATLRNLWPLMAPGGRYFIEDVVLYDLPLPKWFQDRADDFNADVGTNLILAIAGLDVLPRIHDFRAKSGKPDSVLIELRKP